MDNSILDNTSPEEHERLVELQAELEGLEFAPLLKKLMKQFDLSSVKQTAVSAEIDDSILNKILKGEHHEFKAKNVDALLDDLETLDKLTNLAEKEIWRRELRIAAFLHYDFYKSVEPRLKEFGTTAQQEIAWKIYRRQAYPAAAKTYDETKEQLGQPFPLVLPLADLLAAKLKGKDWIKVPEGFELLDVEEDSYLIWNNFQGEGFNLPPDYKVEWAGFRKFRVRRKPPEPSQPDRRPAKPTARFIEPEMVRVPAGEFWMGSDEGDKEAYSDDEKPRHRVYLPEFWIGRYLVTNEEYRLFLLDDRSRKASSAWQGRDFPMGKANHPVQYVSWKDALAYCQWLSRLSGGSYTLPSEAEWEKAARGKDGLKYPWGDDWQADLCNTSESKINDTTPVGKYSSLGGDSPYGCADMAGNVAEWTRSLLEGDKSEFKYPYDPQDKQRENLNAADKVRRVVRGGSFIVDRWFARCASRTWNYWSGLHGFRVVAVPFRL
ncbi:MAG: formylglycine-generating enzyme family protein [Chloroflexi bacterium]|nr:formylglycine-generating enzyme family protein [Chloroflexota bacterium]